MDLSATSFIGKQENQFQQASVTYDTELGTAFCYMKPQPRPCFTTELLHDIKTFQHTVAQRIRSDLEQTGHSRIKYVVLASGLPHTYSLGGDLDLFIKLIRGKDRGSLLNYALDCIRSVHGFSINLELPVTTISLVQGNAQGGGFEVALSCNVIIAERGTYMGFPEVLFNLFPGMGAYSFISRKVNNGLAERLILSGDLYSAEQLYELGIVDVLAESGKGYNKLQEYIRSSNRRTNARKMVRHTRMKYNNVPYEELLDITELWVDSALQLSEADLRTMERLVRFQNRKMTMHKDTMQAQTL